MSTNRKVMGLEFSLLIFIVLLSIVIGIRNPEFLTIHSILDVLKDSSILLISAVGMMMIILTGGIDLSIGSTLGLSGMVCALAVRDFPSLPLAVIFCIALFVGAVIGCVNGVLVARFDILPIMATLGMMNICRALIYFVAKGKWVNTFELTKEFIGLSNSNILGISYLVLIAVLIFAVFSYFLKYSRTGRKIYAVGSNPQAAKISGISNRNIIFLVYLMMGCLGGIAGLLYTSRYAFASFESGTGFEMSVIAACVLGGVSITGGTGKLTGVLFGVLLIGIIDAALPMIQISSFVKETLEGVIILVAVVINVLMERKSKRMALKSRII
ncbi:MAG: ABC transporter permease [Blautia sp.]|jgi:rhamnose transport system permease protein